MNEHFVKQVKTGRIRRNSLYDEHVIIIYSSILKGEKAMANTELGRKNKTKIEDASSLKGTLASVFILGLFLIGVWAGVYILFTDRF